MHNTQTFLYYFIHRIANEIDEPELYDIYYVEEDRIQFILQSQFGQFSSLKRALADLYAEYDIDLISTLHEIVSK